MLSSQKHCMHRGAHAASRASALARPQRRFSTFAQASTQQHPSFVPSLASEIKEEAAHNLMKRMQRLAVEVPSYKQPVLTAAVAPTEDERAKHAGSSPIVMLHGFDSSSLEFRRLYPLLAEQTQTWAIDLVRLPMWFWLWSLPKNHDVGGAVPLKTVHPCTIYHMGWRPFRAGRSLLASFT